MTVLNLNFLLTNYSKFAVECHCAKYVRNWGFLKKIGFSKSVSVANLLENAYQIILFFKNVSFAPKLMFCKNTKNFI